jgi:predicted transcriptional regulator
MSKSKPESLSRRERQIMDVVYRKGSANVNDVLEALPDPPSYSAVRATLGVLEEKGLLTHRKEGRRFTYVPTQSRAKARQSALQHVIQTFFDDSPEGAVAALLEMRSTDLSPEALQRIRDMIEQAEEEESE